MQDVECGLWRYYGICEGLSHIVNLQCQVLQRGILRKNYYFCGMKDLGLKIYTETNLFLSVISTLNENWFERDRCEV